MTLLRQATELAARLCAEHDSSPGASGKQGAPDGDEGGAALEGSSVGRFDFTIGLVGKPSAGKSTFFNAVTAVTKTDEMQARIGAFPFTTIEPNIGWGYVAVPDPCGVLGLAQSECAACYGHADGFQAALERADKLSRVPELHALAAAHFGSAAAEHNALRWRKVPVTIKDVAGAGLV